MIKTVSAIAAIILAASMIPLANAKITVSPAMDECLRNQVMAYGLLVSSGSPMLPELNTTMAIIEDKCLNK